ncbi:hypothetical protein T440DRAFT_477125 [Plenodomus tracheiphilus IPT5]|uniref:Uncharacterized protein n=1 Tax=Plenodomus tracheiphilus IPT5 TaxID=1408161 RepID=A0A6A7BGU2_9PLEO|nr:hypothetical protein T440DRAFT_477125 [Plenodomus tracheiphilus IPT5]
MIGAMDSTGPWLSSPRPAPPSPRRAGGCEQANLGKPRPTSPQVAAARMGMGTLKPRTQAAIDDKYTHQPFPLPTMSSRIDARLSPQSHGFHVSPTVLSECTVVPL